MNLIKSLVYEEPCIVQAFYLQFWRAQNFGIVVKKENLKNSYKNMSYWYVKSERNFNWTIRQLYSLNSVSMHVT